MVEMALKNVYKKYGNTENYSVTGFNLSIKDREFVIFVSPSGYGKSTTLRMITGPEDVSEGEPNIGGKVMNGVALKGRDIAMVFQDHALYPHITVFDNMAFSLKLCKYGKTDIKKRVDNAAEILDLTEYLKQKPTALSGGQRQRMTLGRIIVRDAKVFLMDGPLSDLDTKLRITMRTGIAKLHQRLETTTIYVTHDQTETMTMADQVVIMKNGFIQQIDTPKEVYDTPANMFAAGSVGSPSINFFNTTLKNGVITDGYGLRLRIPEGENKVLAEKGYKGREVVFGIRQENIHGERVALEISPEAVVKPEVVVSELLGAETMFCTGIGSIEFISKVDARGFHKPGEVIDLAFNTNKGHFFDRETE